MPKGSFHSISSILIIDDTIVDADINSAANITRTKMNETQELRLRTGAQLKIYETANTKYMQIHHNGTSGKIFTSAGTCEIGVVGGQTTLKYPTVNSSLIIYGSGGTNTVTLTHDNTDGSLTSSTGLLKLDAGSDIQLLQNTCVRDGKNLDIFDSANTDRIRISHDGSHTYLANNVGDMFLKTATGKVRITQSGVNSMLRIFDTTEAKYIDLTHNSTNAKITSSAGDIIISPAGNVDLDNNEINGVNFYRYESAQTGKIVVCARDFHPLNSDNTDWDRALGQPWIKNNDGAWNQHQLTKYIVLPNAAIVTSLKIHYKRTEGTITCLLQSYPLDDTARTDMASITATGTAGTIESNEDTTISGATINKAVSGYTLELSVLNVDNISDAVPYFIEISFTYVDAGSK